MLRIIFSQPAQTDRTLHYNNVMSHNYYKQFKQKKGLNDRLLTFLSFAELQLLMHNIGTQ